MIDSEKRQVLNIYEKSYGNMQASGQKSEQILRQKQFADSREDDDEWIDCMFSA